MRHLLIAGCTLACIALSGCAGMPGVTGGSVDSQVAALKDIITDPRCGHEDSVDIIVGAAGIPGSFQAHAKRTCPMPAPAAAPATPTP